MSCVITYKGNKYTQEQFKEYISSDKNEFSHIIASNKNVIDSFKRKMEGIDYVFSQSPELTSIGSKTQYLQYLSTIFKTSKVKEIVYHGSLAKDIASFNKSRFLSGEGAMAFGQGFYFTKAINTAKYYSDTIYANMYDPSKMDEGDILAYKSMTNEERVEVFTGKIYPTLINVNNPVNWEEASSKKREELKQGVYKENDSIIHESKGFTKIHGNRDEMESLSLELYANELALEEGNLGDPEYIVTPEIREEFVARNKEIRLKLKSFSEFIEGETHFIIPEPEQIHILGSKQDIEGFKDFVGKNDTVYQNTSTQSNEEFIASEKTIRDLSARISDRIGIPVRFESDRTKKYKGKLENDIAYINLAYATLDTPIHEILGHPIIRTILKSNISIYNNLLKELETGKGKEVLDRIKGDYVYKNAIDFDTTEINNKEPAYTKEYSKVLDYAKKEGFFNEDPFSIGDFTQEKTFSIEGETYKTIIYKDGSSSISKLPKYTLEEQQEEAIVELLGLMTAEKLSNVKDGKLISLLKRLLKEMKAFMRSLLSQREVEIDKLPDNMTLGDLADLLAYSNSKLILPDYEVAYTTPDNQQFKTYSEASNHISDLAKNVEDVDLSNVKVNRKLTNINQIEENEFLDAEGFRYFRDNSKWYSKYDVNKETPLSDDLILSAYNTKDYSYSISDESQEVNVTGKHIEDFIEKNKEYEQSKEIIEEWKKVNNIQYNPEEVYSRGQEFVSVVGAYSSFDVNLMMQNLLVHIEDNEKAGGKFAISTYTKPVGKQIDHLEGGGGKIKFKLYPQSKDILWASNIDVYSGSVWDASEKVNKDKKSELLGVSYTKYPSLRNVNTVQPNLASIIDNLVHHHNELGIVLTGNNFRLEYDEDIPYQTKKIINGINKILDAKYGKLIRPEIKKGKIEKYKIRSRELFDGEHIESEKIFNTLKEAEDFIKSREVYSAEENIKIEVFAGMQPTQIGGSLKESIDSVIDRFKISVSNINYKIVKSYSEVEFITDEAEFIGYRIEDSSSTLPKELNILYKTEQEAQKAIYNFTNKNSEKEYTSQALINTKIAKLKEVAKKYPRSLIRSEVRRTIVTNKKLFERDELPFQLVGNTKETPKQLPTLKLPRSERDVVKPSQVLLPWKFAGKLSKYMKDGKLDMSKIDPKILRGFGFRIPNSGPNSQVAFEIVGFLPKNEGDQAIVSKDLVTQMGHDFDFDTFYTYLYETVEYNGVLQPITKELKSQILTDLGVSKEDEVKLLEQISAKKIELEELKELKELTYNTASITKDYEKLTKKKLNESSADLFKELSEYKELTEVVKGDLNKLFLLKEILANPNSALKNELLDIHIAVQSNPDKGVQKQIKRPIGRWILGDFANWMDSNKQKKLDREKANIDAQNEEIIKANRNSTNQKKLIPYPIPVGAGSDLTQTEKLVSGKAGKAGVSVYALFNTFLSVLVQKDPINAKDTSEQITYKNQKADKLGTKELVDWFINIGGVVSSGRLDNQFSFDGGLKTEKAEGLQSVSVDNANDVIMDKINLNKNTFKFTVGGISLGYGAEIPLIMNQPIIIEYIKAIEENTPVGSKPKDVERAAFKIVMEKYKNKLGYDLTDENTDYSNKVFLLNKGAHLTNYNLKNMISGENVVKDNDLLQLVALTVFKEIENVGASIQGIMGNSNTDSVMLSKNIIETTTKESLLETKLNESTIVNIDKVLGVFNGKLSELKPTTISGYATKLGLVFNNQLWNSIVPFNDPAIKRFFSAAEEAFSIKATGATTLGNFRTTMWSNLKSFLYTDPDLLTINGSTLEEKNRLFMEQPESGKISLASYVAILKETYTNHAFLNILGSDVDKQGVNPSTLYTTDAMLEPSDMNLLYSSFLNMVINEVALPDFNGEPYSTRKLAKDLAVGALLMGGVADAKNYIRIIPPVYLYNLKSEDGSENYLEKLSKYVEKPRFNDLFSRVDLGSVIEQIVKNNPKLLPTKKAKEFKNRGNNYILREETTEHSRYINLIGNGKVTKILTHTGNGNYVEISNQSRKNFRNYDFNVLAVNTPSSHFTLKESTVEVEIEPTTGVTATENLGLKDGGIEVINNALSLISGTSESTYNKSLANLFKEFTANKNILINVGNVLSSSGIPVKGNYKVVNGNIVISVNTNPKVYPNGINSLDLEETLLHELTHAITIDSYNKAKQLVNSGKASTSVTTTVMALDDLFKTYKEKIGKMRTEGLSVDVPTNSTKDIYEFMSELFTNKDVQRLANSIEYGNKKSIFDKFTELITKLLKDLGFGVDTTTSMAISDIIELVQDMDNVIAEKEGVILPDMQTDRPIQKYFPSITEVIKKYNVFTDGVRTTFVNKSDAEAKVSTINSEQGVYRASTYKLFDGTYAIDLVRDSRMDNIDYAYDNLTKEGKDKLNKDIC